MKNPERYNPIMVVLHWLTVLLILGAGFLADNEGGGSSPIDIHMILGALLLVVLVLRLVLRFVTRRPAWADTGNAVLNRLGELVHWGLYAVAFFILGMGGWIAYNRNLFAAVTGSGTAGGRVGFTGEIHSFGWSLAVLLILGHVGAAFYHQFVIKDNLIARMWFGKA
ncbi:MAG: cytochrome b/b6 domain-containing protein [Chloroflexota bacterium]